MADQLDFGASTTNGIAVGQIWDRKEPDGFDPWDSIEVVKIDEAGMVGVKPARSRYDPPTTWLAPQSMKARYRRRRGG